MKPVSRVSLVIPAAGRGTRFGGPTPKQLLLLKKRAVLLRSLDAFAGQIHEAVLAVSDELRAEVEALLINAGLPFPVRLTVGGDTRQASVHAGLLATDPTCEVVLVHDAVRPLVPASCIAACIAALRDQVAAVVAVPCAATVKRARSDGTVDTTVAREDLWLAQTPQGLRRAEGLVAFNRAAAEGWSCSDDAQVMERAGHRVALVMGDARNLKLTTPDDWAVAEALLDSKCMHNDQLDFLIYEGMKILAIKYMVESMKMTLKDAIELLGVRFKALSQSSPSKFKVNIDTYFEGTYS